MKKISIIAILALALIGTAVFASGPVLVSTGTGTTQAPAIVHNVVLPSDTFTLGTLASGQAGYKEFTVTNNSNVSETITAAITGSTGITVTSAEFPTVNSSTITLTKGNDAKFTVEFTAPILNAGDADVPVSLEVTYTVI